MALLRLAFALCLAAAVGLAAPVATEAMGVFEELEETAHRKRPRPRGHLVPRTPGPGPARLVVVERPAPRPVVSAATIRPDHPPVRRLPPSVPDAPSAPDAH